MQYAAGTIAAPMDVHPALCVLFKKCLRSVPCCSKKNGSSVSRKLKFKRVELVISTRFYKDIRYHSKKASIST